MQTTFACCGTGIHADDSSRRSGCTCWPTFLQHSADLREDFVDDSAVDIGQSEIPALEAIREPFMIETE